MTNLPFLSAMAEFLKTCKRTGFRSINISMYKEYMERHGITRTCLNCGAPLKGRKRTWCSQKCANDFYNHTQWPMIRARILKANPTCQSCKKEKSTEVHHKEPIKAQKDIGIHGDPFEESNLEALCDKCHDAAHKNLNKETALVKQKIKLSTPPLENYL